MLFTSSNAEAHQVTVSLVKLLSKIYPVGLATIVALPLLIGISSCSQGFFESVRDTAQNVSQSVQAMQSFRAVLVNKYHKREIGIEINHTYAEKGWIQIINVEFINTSFNKVTASERQKIARDVAQLAKNHFALDKPEDSVSVSFVESRNYAVLQYRQVIDSYTLHPSDLAPISPPSSSPAQSTR